MELSKLFLLCCSFLVSFSKCDDTTTVTEKQGQLEQTTVPNIGGQNYGSFRRFNELTNNLRQCFCFLQKSPGEPVTQKLKPSGDKLQRLVVYLYKDGLSDDLKIYLPNYEKQLMIPDLALDQGDILEPMPSNGIESIFIKYPHLQTNRDNIDNADIAQIIDPMPLNQNTDVPITFDDGTIPVENTPIPNNNDASPSEQPLIPYLYNQVPDEEQTSQDENGYDDFSGNTNYIPQLQNDNMEQVTEEPYSVQELNTSQDSEIPEDLEDEAVKVEQINQYFDLNPKDIDNSGSPSAENNFNININLDMSGIDEEQTERPTKIYVTTRPIHENLNPVPHVKVEKPEPIKNNGYITRLELPDSNIPDNIPVPINPLIWNTINSQYPPIPTSINKIRDYVPERNMIYPVPIEKPKIWHHNLYNPNRKIVTFHPHRLIQKYQYKEPNDGSDINLQDTFDSWLTNQLEKVQFADSEASNSIDIYTLKDLIGKTLRDSGFYIAQNGLVVDSNGDNIHTANLVLRPILIGNSVEYKKLLKGKVGTFKLPTDLPYLEAVLITSINPQKILGIIPLGKKYLPKHYRTPLSLYVDSERSGCGKCNEKGPQSRKYYQTDFTPGRVEDFYNQYPSRLVTTNYSPYINEQRFGINQIIPRHYTSPIQRERIGRIGGTRRVFPFDQIKSVIDNVYKVPVLVDQIKYVDNPYFVDYNVQPVVPTKTYPTEPIVKYPASVVTPGFRIIGGNAATSSGTPVSSKGRSGFEPTEVNSIVEK